MYRQVQVKPEHRAYQCILWRSDPNMPPSTFCLNTVTYGTAAAPFLATRCLRQLALDTQEKYPRTARVLEHDFYVDDLITGKSSIRELMQTKNEVTEIPKTAGFELTKFWSNIPSDQIEHLDTVELTDTKVLGLLWHSSSDPLRYEATGNTQLKVITKRTILSTITQIFDPLGLIGPVIIRAKIILQKLWQIIVEWDEPLPEELQTQWLSYYEELPAINDIKIPRHTVLPNSIDIQIQGFCDASQIAYGACIYLRSQYKYNNVNIPLLTVKSRIAPLKAVPLPRLELCGAVLLANLYQKVRQALTCSISNQYFWTDSEIVLAWIQREPAQWQILVGNKIAEIQQLTRINQWSHVKSEDNPANIISHGIQPNELMNARLWWEGPLWLRDNATEWPKSTNSNLTEIPEERCQTITFACIDKTDDLILRFSSLNKLKRVTACCFRFINNCKRRKEHCLLLTEPFTSEELRQAMNALLKIHQQIEFANELQDLQRSRTINSHSKIISLNPILDSDGPSGRSAKKCFYSFIQRHPILLSPRHVLTDLIVRDYHQTNFHTGPQLLMSLLRETYWIIQAKTAVKRILHKCVLCFRMRPQGLTQQMADLPASRVTPSRAFNHTGVDYAGPFNIKISRNKSGKAYLCLFICMATKAVHLELVSDLTTDMFLNTLKRFIARRGKCATMSSDNGKIFIGASNVLMQLGDFLTNREQQGQTITFASNHGINWKFIPAYSPHMGGSWEANIKVVKSHLKAVIHNTLLSFEELYTILTQVEAILNSRPLCPLSNDPEELEVLTPGHFLIGPSLHSLPEQGLTDVPTNYLNRYQLLIQLQQSFWNRWSRDYIA